MLEKRIEVLTSGRVSSKLTCSSAVRACQIDLKPVLDQTSNGSGYVFRAALEPQLNLKTRSVRGKSCTRPRLAELQQLNSRIAGEVRQTPRKTTGANLIRSCRGKRFRKRSGLRHRRRKGFEEESHLCGGSRCSIPQVEENSLKFCAGCSGRLEGDTRWSEGCPSSGWPPPC